MDVHSVENIEQFKEAMIQNPGPTRCSLRLSSEDASVDVRIAQSVLLTDSFLRRIDAILGVNHYELKRMNGM